MPSECGKAFCLFNNRPYKKPGYGNTMDHARRDRETNMFRRRLTEAGIVELGYGTYPPAGEDSAGYTYAMLIDADESQAGRILDDFHDAVRESDELVEQGIEVEEEAQTEEQEEDEDDEVVEASTVNVGEASRVSRVRVGQDAFSRAVRANYGHRCCFPGCEVDHDSLLVGAHIARWADSAASRGEVSNGLCLCGLHDKAFETRLFTLTDDFRVVVNPRKASRSKWVESQLRQAEGLQIRLGKIRPSLIAIREHRDRFT
jgi:HNH endonuclease